MTMYHAEDLPRGLDIDRQIHEGEIGIYPEKDVCHNCGAELDTVEDYEGICYDCIKDMYTADSAVAYLTDNGLLDDFIDYLRPKPSWGVMWGFYLKPYCFEDFDHWADYIIKYQERRKQHDKDNKPFIYSGYDERTMARSEKD